MGRQVAGHEFFRAYLQYGEWTDVSALVRNQRSIEHLRNAWNSRVPRSTAQRLRVIDESGFHAAILEQPSGGVIHYPVPPDSRYAWSRASAHPHAYALCGVTHTLSSPAATRQITDYVTAPFQPYDALVCTSSAVVSMVRAVSDAYCEHLQERLGGHPRLGIRLETIPLGVDTDRFRPAAPGERAAARQALGISEDEVAVLFVGRISHHAKAHPYPMFQGLGNAARQTQVKTHLILAGWAAHPCVTDAFLAGAQAFAPEVRITLVDGMDPAQRERVWRAADLFTSLPDSVQETFGLVMIEAMASGLPAVAADWNGYRDLLCDGETGLFVPTRMVAGATGGVASRLLLGEIDYDTFLAECSQATTVDPFAAGSSYARLLMDHDLRGRMAVAARKRALQHYAWPVIIRAYESLWRDQELQRSDRERVACAKKQNFLGPAVFPDPEHAFADYPTSWLRKDDMVISSLDGKERLGSFLEMPLTHHAPARRVTEEPTLADLIDAAKEGASVGHLADLLSQRGVKPEKAFATLAWLLKYGLLTPCTSGSKPPSRDRSTARLTFVIMCKGRLSDLKQTLGAVVAQPRCECVVVDYSCPEGTGDWVEQTYPHVHVVRVLDRPYLNRAEARNIGLRAASAEWVCFLDADVLIDPRFVSEIEARMQPKTYLVADPYREGTEGTFCCAREDLDRVGGYDEAYEDWGEEDNDLYDALKEAGLQRATFPSSLLLHLAHEDAERAQYHRIEPRKSHVVNRVYRILKWDCQRLRGTPLSLEHRQALYRTIRSKVLTCLDGVGEGTLRLHLPHGIIPDGNILERALDYRLIRSLNPGGSPILD
jgi:glycosyltransferase involved in cell wall biosynthesis/GT2 family glycosyltransferase